MLKKNSSHIHTHIHITHTHTHLHAHSPTNTHSHTLTLFICTRHPYDASARCSFLFFLKFQISLCVYFRLFFCHLHHPPFSLRYVRLAYDAARSKGDEVLNDTLSTYVVSFFIYQNSHLKDRRVWRGSYENDDAVIVGSLLNVQVMQYLCASHYII